jgi:hypothetical protein
VIIEMNPAFEPTLARPIDRDVAGRRSLRLCDIAELKGDKLQAARLLGIGKTPFTAS